MKSNLLRSLYACIPLILLVACSTATQDEKYRQVVMRDIGNKILWSLGDSVSRVMPVVSAGSTYTISFEHPVAVSYDSLIVIVSQELIKNDITRFVTELRDCGSREVLLAFAFKSPSDSLAPCTGRNTQLGCYQIEITLMDAPFNYASALPFAIAAAGAGLLFVFFKSRQKRPHSNEGTNTADARQRLHLGRYIFDVAEKTLVIDDTILPLTEKEAKLLSLLLANIHQTISRETLMAEIWGEEGLVVIPKNIDVLVSKLRKKLIHDDSIAITNVHGVGYKLVDMTVKG